MDRTGTSSSNNGERPPVVALLALALLVALLILVLGPRDEPYLELLRRGDEHAADAERTAAVAAYEEATKLRPGKPVPYVRLARVYLDWGRAEEAVTPLAIAERLVEVQAEKAEVESATLERLWVAVQVARGDWSAVVEHARRLLELVPGDRDARLALARAHVAMEEWGAAEEQYGALLEADSADALAHERLGALLVGTDPAVIAHLFAAQSDLAGRLLAALEELGTADDPAYAAALLGHVLLEEREWALAVRHFRRALSHNADYADAHAFLGYALDQVGRPDEARPHLLRAVGLAPDSPVAHIFLGLHYERTGDVSSARAQYERAYDLDPTNPATCVEIGQTWAAERRYVAAEIWLREAVSLQPQDPALWEALARFYLDHHIVSGGRAVEAAARLVELSPDDARAHDLRGWAAFQVGEFDTAEESIRRALSLDPTLASAHYHLGLLWDARGVHEEAQRAFVRAIDLDTGGEIAPLVERVIDETSRVAK